MVSLQTTSLLPDEEIKKTMATSLDLPSFLSVKRKRKDDEEGESEDLLLLANASKLQRADKKKKKKMEAEEEERVALNLDGPLPLDWQRCLDIKSGQIHFYNTRTHRRTSTDPTRLSLEPPPPANAASRPRPSLDLELNLACEPPPATGNPEDEFPNTSSGSFSWMTPNGSSSAAASAVDEEMVAAVCMRCHMLVMMSKDALSCPNCKFVHPADHRRASLMMKLLCCRD